MCRSKVSRNVSVVESTDQDAFIGVVQDSKHTNPLVITLAVNGKPLKFKIDTGADVSVIPHKVFKSIPGARPKPAEKILSGPGHKVLPVKGQFVATLWHGDKQVTEDVFVVWKLSCALLGRPAIEFLDLVSRVNTVQVKKNLLHKFPKLFDGLGQLEGEYKILKEDAKLYALTTPQCVAIPMLPKVKAELECIERRCEPCKRTGRLVRWYGGGS